MSEKAMAPHSSTLAWKIPRTKEPGRLQSMGSLRIGHNSVTSLSLLCTGEGNGNPLQCSCLENPRDGGAWWAAVYGVAQSRTWLKRLSSSSSNSKGALGVYTVFSNKRIRNFSGQLVFVNLALQFCNLQFYIDTMAGYVFIWDSSNAPNPSSSMSYFPFLTLKLEKIMWIYSQNFSIGTENNILKAVCVTFSFFP